MPGTDVRLVENNALYRYLDKVLPHKMALFHHLTEPWQELFSAQFDILLYDLTSTGFESSPPKDESDELRYGSNRNKHSDCSQVSIALVVTPEGFSLTHEVLTRNIADKTTLKGFLQQIKAQCGKAKRTWVMDRGIPLGEVLEDMRAADPPAYYLVGIPDGRLPKLEHDLLYLYFVFVLSLGAPGR
ncbi:MAG: IS1634 family transposase [Nitrospira sp.]|nr:IS1634 family transposase [Nitrospira sp.]